MHDRDGMPADEMSSFLSGMEFGLIALRGRLRQLEDPSDADLAAAIEAVRSHADRMRESTPAAGGDGSTGPR